jgi:CRISPR-associated protein Cmr4
MFDNNLTELCFFYCLSPLHAGAGQATGAIDLPIQRERHTAWPQVQSSGVKGAFRHWFYTYQINRSDEKIAKDLTRQVFGAEESADSENGQAGAVSFSDARLLAFPVRSNVAPFVWITCPSVLDRLNRDLLMVSGQRPLEIEAPEPEKGFVILDKDGYLKKPDKIILEDLCIDVAPAPDSSKSIALLLDKLVPRVKRLILVSDSDYAFIVRTATEIQPQIKIKMETGTAQDGS